MAEFLSRVMCRDRIAFERELSRVPAKMRSLEFLPNALKARIEASIAARLLREQNRPALEFPDALPVSAKRGEIEAAIRDHQVVIVCGETGSGKTTQLPKICLEMGRGVGGLIGHTQPRRIAARATASRIAEELRSELGRHVGYKIRFTDRLSEASYIKLMTDGILLAETQGDPLLSAYDTLIIDEAHERSLNIDFLLGYLRELLPRRPDLKLIITSATLDAERFARHFTQQGVTPPVIEVSGRLYPIELRYRPVAQGADLFDALIDAVDEAHREGPGDVLVFLPGEREIREAEHALRRHHVGAVGVRSQLEILPLYARLSAAEQARVFAPHQGRRVVLATNVAETSLTVPGIRFVIDTGLARIKRYSHRNKVEQLQIEPIAQSAAKQRAGRCGRVASGVCFRLFEEDDFNRRPAHTEPEILRSSLAGVILRMKSLGLADVEAFPFVDQPLPRMIQDGYQLLGELGAVDEARTLTPLGRELARLPLDPRIGRMVLAARDEGALTEVLIIAAALSIPDPRDRPAEHAGAADQAHAKFRGPEPDQKSEFLSFVHLWRAFDEHWQHESQAKQRAWCRQHFVNYLRMREWRDVHSQLMALVHEHSWRVNEKPASFEAIHCALLTGLLGNIGCKAEDEGHYLGARGIKFFPHPGSALAKKAGKWVMAAELVETSRLFARCLARLEPEWLERVGGHLLRRQYLDPHWEKRSGQVVALERATLYGLVVVPRRPVSYTRMDPALCREIFIRSALVEGELPDEVARHAPFFQANARLIAEIEKLEHKTRRPDVLADDELIYAFFDAKIPADVCDVRSFEHWRREAEREAPKCLFLDRNELMRHEAAGVTTERFPHAMDVRGTRCKLAYHHAPGAEDDGVCLIVPLPLLNQVSAHRCEWLVPGMLQDKVLALIKTLPQKVRHRLMPLPAFAEKFCEAEHDTSEPLLRVLQGAVEDEVQLKVPLESFRLENLSPHHFMYFRVIDEHGRIMGAARQLNDLRSRFAAAIGQQFEQAKTAQEAAPPAEKITRWDFGELPELMEVNVAGRSVIGIPALVDGGDHVSLKVFDVEEKAAREHRAGVRRLLALNLRDQVKAIEKGLPGLRDLALQFMSFGTEAELREQLLAATLERCVMQAPLPVNAAQFEARCAESKSRMMLIAQEIARVAGGILSDHALLQKKLAAVKHAPALTEDIRAQLTRLLPENFLIALPWERLAHLPRYLKAINMRLDKYRNDPARDARHLAEWQAIARPFEREVANRARAGVMDSALEEFRWLLEELRVQLFAQELRTPMPVSVKRLEKIWAARG
ncbi:MAG: hypothetical protein RIR70_1526 [Pseudomonadota bacterium]